MTAYEINLLLTCFFGAIATISLVSLLLSEGSVASTFLLALIAGGFYYFAGRTSDEGVSAQDISPAISKLLSYFIG